MYTPDQYKNYAEQACELEKQGNWKLARELWDLAGASARDGRMDRIWAHTRATLCSVREQRSNNKIKHKYAFTPNPKPDRQ